VTVVTGAIIAALCLIGSGTLLWRFMSSESAGQIDGRAVRLVITPATTTLWVDGERVAWRPARVLVNADPAQEIAVERSNPSDLIYRPSTARS